MSEAAARLVVSRRSPRDVQQRQMIVSLDGEPLATLLYGESAARPLNPGRHTLRVHNTLVWKHAEFDAAPGEEVRFTIVNRPGWATWWLLSLLGAGPLYVSIEREPIP